ncbi:ABC transporter permease subunit [Antarcticirhabdus aurantiaca]|uniref:ABC transporter permease subunit n=1 Tax=Antarcticirhabdus aurantiaca TaxID=2606717 RepID=A0ACD4NMD0_9HYPH|nr:ABC transporter permease subunit [Antarcticirhabdus aurantiaca]WAJ27845.1 ABC transporter permease subunit [Jeongeuplla avenae]
MSRTTATVLVSPTEAAEVPPVTAAPARRRPPLPVAAISAATLSILVGLWSLAAWAGWVSSVFLPSPLAVLEALDLAARSGFADASLLQHTLASLSRVFGALLAALLVGVPIGIAIATSRIGRGIFDPIVEVLRPLPPLAYLPLVIIWFGIGEASKILVIGLAMGPPIIIATAAGVRSASTDRIRAARSLGASPRDVLRFVVMPSAVPSILTGVRIALGAGWSTLIAAELIAAPRGLGTMIQAAAGFLATDIVIAGIVVIAAIAILFEAALRRLERRFVPWATRL